MGPFAANGGYNWTYIPRAGSPAIDKAGGDDQASLYSADDERHVARPMGPRWDIGAVEKPAKIFIPHIPHPFP